MKIVQACNRADGTVGSCIYKADGLATVRRVCDDDYYTIRVSGILNIRFGRSDGTQKGWLPLSDQLVDDILDAGGGTSSSLVSEIHFWRYCGSSTDIRLPIVVVCSVSVAEYFKAVHASREDSALEHLVMTLSAVDASARPHRANSVVAGMWRSRKRVTGSVLSLESRWPGRELSRSILVLKIAALWSIRVHRPSRTVRLRCTRRVCIQCWANIRPVERGRGRRSIRGRILSGSLGILGRVLGILSCLLGILRPRLLVLGLWNLKSGCICHCRRRSQRSVKLWLDRERGYYVDRRSWHLWKGGSTHILHRVIETSLRVAVGLLLLYHIVLQLQNFETRCTTR